MMRIAVLVSGGGTNLQAILESERRGENPNGKVTLVVASKPGVYALERAANFGVETAVVRRRDYASGEDCTTPTPGIFVAGDCRAKKIRQITTAVADGAVAALAACAYIDNK